MGEMREYLKQTLSKFEDPVIFISSEFIKGCPMCNSSTSIYYITLTDRNLIPENIILEKVQKHKFPVDVYVNYQIERPKPKQFVIGTKESKGKLKMILRRIVE